jgi:hypothetical protein
MTIRFRAAEADELVDDKLSAQRIYLGSAMTMENGEFLSSDSPRFPTPRSCLQPASHCFCQWTPPAVPQFSHPHPSAPILQPSVSFPCPKLSLASTTCHAAMLETGLFVSTLAGLVRLYWKDSCARVPCNVGHPALVSRARSPAYKGQLCTAHARGVILAVHRIACIAGLRGPLLTCRSRNAAPAATSAAQRLLSGL